MTVLEDQWTPLFSDLESRVNEEGATRLMFQCVGELYDSALSNFNGEGAPGDMRPWNEETIQSPEYARLVERDLATLVRTDEERARCSGTKWQGVGGPHLKDSFEYAFDRNGCVLANTSEYASNHQNGEGVPRRPFFPVDESGNLMPFMEDRLKAIVEGHFTHAN